MMIPIKQNINASGCRKASFLQILILLTFSATIPSCITLPAETVEPKELFKDFDKVKERIQILPITPQFPEDILKKIESEKEEQPALFSKTNFNKWVKHEDEIVSFYYPKYPDLELNIHEGYEYFKVLTDVSPESPGTYTTNAVLIKTYALQYGEKNYCVLELQEANEFDYRICMCGRIAYAKYIPHNNNLLKISFLTHGAIKKIEALSDKHRVILKDITHMPLPEDIYLKIALSVKLKTRMEDLHSLKNEFLKENYFKGKLGFIEKGMNKDDVLQLIGKPQRETQNQFVYKEINDEHRYKLTTKIAFNSDGIFEGLKEDWETCIGLAPKNWTI
ncbi:hypothetical protein ACFLS1_10900 [Verrucomicrobiota bacterium]